MSGFVVTVPLPSAAGRGGGIAKRLLPSRKTLTPNPSLPLVPSGRERGVLSCARRHFVHTSPCQIGRRERTAPDKQPVNHHGTGDRSTQLMQSVA